MITIMMATVTLTGTVDTRITITRAITTDTDTAITMHTAMNTKRCPSLAPLRTVMRIVT